MNYKPGVYEISGPELIQLDAELKAEGKYYIAIAEVAQINRWRVTIRPL